MNRGLSSHRAGRLRDAALLLGCGLVGACGSSTERSAPEQGLELFQSKALSPSRLNDYSCADCHDTQASDPPRKKAGAPLAGATLRPTFWGGQEAELLGAINACRKYFMSASEPLTATDSDARFLYAYLESLEPGDPEPSPFTIVTTIDPLPRGNSDRGQILFVDACQSCHGDTHRGVGRLSTRVPILPEDTLAEHVQYTPRVQRLIFTEKIRHGLFLGYGGVMPPFSKELLSDEEVADVLEALGVLGE